MSQKNRLTSQGTNRFSFSQYLSEMKERNRKVFYSVSIITLILLYSLLFYTIYLLLTYKAIFMAVNS